MTFYKAFLFNLSMLYCSNSSHCMVTAPNCDTYPKASLLDSGQIQPWVEHASLGSVLDTYNQRVKNLQFNHMMSKNYIFIC